LWPSGALPLGHSLTASMLLAARLMIERAKHCA
jgi:hypothetical protein